MKIAAPGVGITAPSGDSGTTTEDGTSFATPQVTGSIVLLQQMYENAYHTLPTVAELDQLLQQGAVTVHDGATGIDVGRLDVLNSATDPQPADPESVKPLGRRATLDTGSSGRHGHDELGHHHAAATDATGHDGHRPATDSTHGTDRLDGPTTDADPTPASTPPASVPRRPLTQVFVNGVSLGNYSTAQLAAKYPGLFAFLKGPVTLSRSGRRRVRPSISARRRPRSATATVDAHQAPGPGQDRRSGADQGDQGRRGRPARGDARPRRSRTRPRRSSRTCSPSSSERLR